MLKVQQVSKWYEGNRGVHKLDFEMQRGEIVGFLGPNGAGKTTTMRMITGYLQPSEGVITIDGIPIQDKGRQARSKIGYLPETPPLYGDMSVQSYLKFVASIRDVPAREQKLRISEMISRLGLNGREKQLVRSLSKGYKQRLGLAGAIIHNPDLLVLDEPTSGLDPNQILEIRQLIQEIGENHTVLLSTHILPEVDALCNRVLIIHEGQLVLDGRPDALGGSMEDGFKVKVEVKGNREQVLDVLQAWGKVEVEPLASALSHADMKRAAREQDLTGVLLTGASNEDFREELFYVLSAARLPILEMKKESLSLENIFQQLTTRETGAGQMGDQAADAVSSTENTATGVKVDHEESASSGDKAVEAKDTGGNQS
ncbi:ABC transporter ATP-binding protein [Paenibacillus brasilensis]|uniref:ABC-2 type transport system ATP-binding protein n=1 Tax=Paenibacillus brasilensis TaxID=128574 RepID=A0ABU0L1M1_9BACL|nr:ATP-binding cassette domain-containing protein [Paenibacillus brasilensis]MDQ0495434.1 ABC-2 type transport system ATP-binding protein [Paenibacillus brasilensis]